MKGASAHTLALQLVRLADAATSSEELLRGVRTAQVGTNRAERHATTAALAHIAACLARRLPDGQREALLAQFEVLGGLQPADREALLTVVETAKESALWRS